MISVKIWNLKVSQFPGDYIYHLDIANKLVVSQNTAEVFVSHFSSRAELN